MQEALRDLPEPYLTALVLHSCDFSYEEIGQLTGVSRITVGSRLNRARERLRERLVELAAEGPRAPRSEPAPGPVLPAPPDLSGPSGRGASA